MMTREQLLVLLGAVQGGTSPISLMIGTVSNGLVDHNTVLITHCPSRVIQVLNDAVRNGDLEWSQLSIRENGLLIVCKSEEGGESGIWHS